MSTDDTSGLPLITVFLFECLPWLINGLLSTPLLWFLSGETVTQRWSIISTILPFFSFIKEFKVLPEAPCGDFYLKPLLSTLTQIFFIHTLYPLADSSSISFLTLLL